MKSNHPNILYYDRHAAEYEARTMLIDMSGIQNEFLSYLQPGACILDAGCGPGRDSQYFIRQGLNVTAFDASYEMVKLARKNSGLHVQQKRLQDLEVENEFDGVWACASLLHLERIELNAVFTKIFKCLKEGGVFYSSFKYGKGKLLSAGRSFTLLDERDLKNLMANNPGFEILKTWKIETDINRQKTVWFNILLRRTAENY
jgi:2-polyprenyl-3-methyl-5-hydroxy-6-metoxy-1,4-benzoquinol methylase